MARQIRVLICDDSRLMRMLMAKMLAGDPEIVVVGEAENGESCLEMIPGCRPDVVLLDLVLPGMSGVECLKKARSCHVDTAFLVVSAAAVKDAPVTVEALQAGAFDYVTKAHDMLQMQHIQENVVEKIKDAYKARAPPGSEAAQEHAGGDDASEPVPEIHRADTGPASRVKLTVVGGSSGCVQTLPALLAGVPADFTGAIVLVLKLPAFVTRQLRVQFANACALPIEEAADRSALVPGRVFIAPGGDHDLILVRDSAGGRVMFQSVPPLERGANGPSIDRLMISASILFGEACRGLLVSGVGNDGIEGMRAIDQAGGETFAQVRDAVVTQLARAALAAGVAKRAISTRDITSLWAKGVPLEPTDGDTGTGMSPTPSPLPGPGTAPARSLPDPVPPGPPDAHSTTLAPRDASPTATVASTAKSPDPAPGTVPPHVDDIICILCVEKLPAFNRFFCPECRRPHHETCWGKNGGCAYRGCTGGRSRGPLTTTTRKSKRPRPYTWAALALGVVLAGLGIYTVNRTASSARKALGAATKVIAETKTDVNEVDAPVGNR